MKMKPCQNDSSKPAFVVMKSTVSSFLTIVNRDLPVKNIVFTTSTVFVIFGTEYLKEIKFFFQIVFQCKQLYQRN